MMKRQTYNKPPIVEAVVDFIFSEPPKEDIQILLTKLEDFGNDFDLGQRTAVQQLTASVELKEESKPSFVQEQEVLGYRFSNQNNTQVLNVRPNGITLSFLRPYPGWEKVEQKALEVTAKYLSIIEPVRLNRVGIRYINKLEIPFGFKDFNEYLHTYPNVGSDIPQGLSGMFFRVIIPDSEDPNTGVVTLGIDELNVTPVTLPLILDVDVFRPVSINTADFEKVWEVVDSLREYRTRLFEGSITDKTRELFA